MERSWQAHLPAQAAGKRHIVDDESAMLTAAAAGGTPYGGWVAFQPLYQRVVREQPDPID